MNIGKHINKKYLNMDNINLLKKGFINKKPIKYLLLKDFFKKEFIENLYKEIRKGNKNKILFSNEKSDKGNINFYFYRGYNLKIMGNIFGSIAFRKIMQYILNTNNLIFNGIEGLDNDFNKIKIINKVKYTEGIVLHEMQKFNFLKWHTNTPDEGEKNFGTMLFYLNTQDINEYGAFLELGEKNDNGEIIKYRQIEPKINSLLIIMYSENAYHRIGKFYKNYIRRLYVRDIVFK